MERRYKQVSVYMFVCVCVGVRVRVSIPIVVLALNEATEIAEVEAEEKSMHFYSVSRYSIMEFIIRIIYS